MKKISRTKKGMTLVEVIVALAIFATLGLILARIGSIVDTTTRSSNKLNRKVNVQSPYAAARQTEYIDPENPVVQDSNGLDVDNYVKLSSYEDRVTVAIYSSGSTPKQEQIKYKKGDGNYETKLEDAVCVGACKVYDTKDIVYKANDVTDPDDDYVDKRYYDVNGANANLNLKFAEVVNTITSHYKFDTTTKSVVVDDDPIRLAVGESFQLIDAYGYSLSNMDVDWYVEPQTGKASAAVSVDSNGVVSANSVSEIQVDTVKGMKAGLYYEIPVEVSP